MGLTLSTAYRPPAQSVSCSVVQFPDDDYDNKITHRAATHLTTVIVETIPPGNNQKPINSVQ